MQQMTWQHFRIKGMDCAEEVGLLRRELLPLVGDEERLRFDLINAKLSVALPAEGQAAALVAAIARTGLSATPWHDAISCRRVSGSGAGASYSPCSAGCSSSSPSSRTA